MPYVYIPDTPTNQPQYPQGYPVPINIPQPKKSKRKSREDGPMTKFLRDLKEQEEVTKNLLEFFKAREEKNKPKEDKKKPLVEFSPVQLATLLTVGGMISMPFFVYSLGYAFASAINSIQMAIHH